MKRVLILLDYYLPNASANGICIDKVIRDFLSRGIEVSIICFQDKDRDKKYLLDNLKIYEINKPTRTRRFEAISYYLKWIFFKKHLPYERKTVCDEMLRLAENVIVENNIDTVICTHLPIETIIVGVKLKEKFKALNVIAYMLDSLSGGLLPRLLPKSFCQKKKISWENRMLSYYNRVILMESSRSHHEIFSVNADWYKSADFLDVPALVPPNSVASEHSNEEIVFCFVGTIGEGIRTPHALLKVLSNILDIKIRFLIAGKNFCEDLSGFLTGVPGITLELLGEIPYDSAQELLCKANFLINLGNVNPNLVPSKIFEYMSYGKPIISTYCSDLDSSVPYLSKYPATFLLDEKREDVDVLSEQLKKFIQCNFETKVSFENVVQNFYNNTPAALYTLLSLSDEDENEKNK